MPQAQTMTLPNRWQLVSTLQQRNNTTSKDARLGNCYAEKDDTTGLWTIQRRPGYSPRIYTSNNEQGAGIFLWESAPYIRNLYSISGASLYKDGVFFFALSPYRDTYDFEPILSSPTTLFFHNSEWFYYTDGTTVTDITAAVNALSSVGWVQGTAYLNGYTYIMDIRCQIWGTLNTDDVSAWDPLNMIVAQGDPSWGVAIRRHLSYILAFKRSNVEVFYDAGNATGSPLASVQGARISYGCVSADTIQDIDDTLLWVSTNKSSQLQVVRLDNLQATVISNAAVERLLLGALIGPFMSISLKIGGHRFYIVSSTTNNITLVYDLDEGLWYNWYRVSGDFWPMRSRCSSTFGFPLVQNALNGEVYVVGEDYIYPTDAGVLFPVDIYTTRWDGGVSQKKTLSNIHVDGDQTQGCIIQVRHCNDDYDTWSNFTNVDLGLEYPVLTNQGTFYQRAYHIRHQKATHFRLSSFNLRLDLGTL